MTTKPKTGKQLKEEGLDRVSENSELFLEHIRKVARYFSKRDGKVTVEILRAYAANQGITPHHPNAWGAVFRGPNWRRIGFQPSSTTSARARIISVWTYEESQS